MQEIQELSDNETWTLVAQSDVNRKLIYCKSVLNVKLKALVTDERHKARLVAKNFQQKKGANCKQSFAPVAKLSSIRLLLSFVFLNGLLIHQVDMRNVFLNCEVDEGM